MPILINKLDLIQNKNLFKIFLFWREKQNQIFHSFTPKPIQVL